MSTAEAMTYLGIRPNGSLSPCPSGPSGVGSCHAGDKRHYLAPIPFRGTGVEAKDKLKAILASMSSLAIVQDEGPYLHYERESLIFRLISDVEFLVDETQSVIHFRAALRYGFWDTGSNARLVKRIQTIFSRLSR